MAVVNLVSHINQHVSMLAMQVVDKAMVEEAEKLRQEFGDQVARGDTISTNAKDKC